MHQLKPTYVNEKLTQLHNISISDIFVFTYLPNINLYIFNIYLVQINYPKINFAQLNILNTLTFYLFIYFYSKFVNNLKKKLQKRLLKKDFGLLNPNKNFASEL